MCLHALPDVQTAVDPDDGADLDRACAAILYACHQMVWRNRPLEAGDIVDVPDVEIGPHAIADPGEPVERDRVRKLESGRLHLHRLDRPS